MSHLLMDPLRCCHSLVCCSPRQWGDPRLPTFSALLTKSWLRDATFFHDGPLPLDAELGFPFSQLLSSLAGMAGTLFKKNYVVQLILIREFPQLRCSFPYPSGPTNGLLIPFAIPKGEFQAKSKDIYPLINKFFFSSYSGICE